MAAARWNAAANVTRFLGPALHGPPERPLRRRRPVQARALGASTRGRPPRKSRRGAPRPPRPAPLRALCRGARQVRRSSASGSRRPCSWRARWWRDCTTMRRRRGARIHPVRRAPDRRVAVVDPERESSDQGWRREARASVEKASGHSPWTVRWADVVEGARERLHLGRALGGDGRARRIAHAVGERVPILDEESVTHRARVRIGRGGADILLWVRAVARRSDGHALVADATDACAVRAAPADGRLPGFACGAAERARSRAIAKRLRCGGAVRRRTCVSCVRGSVVARRVGSCVASAFGRAGPATDRRSDHDDRVKESRRSARLLFVVWLRAQAGIVAREAGAAYVPRRWPS
jgi:hypothetical protein